jgi:O-methyltransferase involved in polyketide biosynthesis
MNEVNRTLYIPLYGKSQMSKEGIILHDPTAEKIWDKEGFTIKGKSKSKWLCYNMAMRARIFDDWTRKMIEKCVNAIIIHIGCGLDSRCLRIDAPGVKWIDCDFQDVIAIRKKYYDESDNYFMKGMDATNQRDLYALPDATCAIVVLEGISMYLTNEQLVQMLRILGEKYREIHILMDVYTVFGAKASKYKNPVNDVGVSTLYGVDSITQLLKGTRISLVAEHSFTPNYLVSELRGFDKHFFKLMFTGKMFRKIYRLYELESK